MYQAIRARDLAALEEAIRLHPDAVDREEDSITSLSLAASLDLPAFVLKLLSAGANPNTVGDGESALFHACGGGLDCVRILLERGADPNLGSKSTGKTPLHRVASRDALEIGALLVEFGANVDSRLQNGETPLYVAALHNSTSVAAMLIVAGASVELPNNRGVTPAAIARQKGPAVFELLRTQQGTIDRGISVEYLTVRQAQSHVS
jgi:ankyrin repeat protein